MYCIENLKHNRFSTRYLQFKNLHKLTKHDLLVYDLVSCALQAALCYFESFASLEWRSKYKNVRYEVRVFFIEMKLAESVIYQWRASQSTYIYRVPLCMSPRRNWDSPIPSLASECAPPPGTKGGGGTLACE